MQGQTDRCEQRARRRAGPHLGCSFVLRAPSWAASLELHEENCAARNLWLKHRGAAMPSLLRPTRVGMLEAG